MARIIAIANYKGGVAKTQTAIELAWWLAKRRCKVLVLDTDPQANTTSFLLAGAEPTGRLLPDILVTGTQATPGDVCSRRIGGNDQIDFVPSDIRLGRIEGRIISDAPKEYIIGDTISDLIPSYDFIIIDMAPSAELLGISSLLAAQEVIIPTCLDKSSIDGTMKMSEMISRIKANPRLNPQIQLFGIIVTRYKKTLNTLFHGNEIEDNFKEYVTHPYIRECIKVQQAFDAFQTIIEYSPDSTAAKDYEAAFAELFPLGK